MAIRDKELDDLPKKEEILPAIGVLIAGMGLIIIGIVMYVESDIEETDEQVEEFGGIDVGEYFHRMDLGGIIIGIIGIPITLLGIYWTNRTYRRNKGIPQIENDD